MQGVNIHTRARTHTPYRAKHTNIHMKTNFKELNHKKLISTNTLNKHTYVQVAFCIPKHAYYSVSFCMPLHTKVRHRETSHNCIQQYTFSTPAIPAFGVVSVQFISSPFTNTSLRMLPFFNDYNSFGSVDGTSVVPVGSTG